MLVVLHDEDVNDRFVLLFPPSLGSEGVQHASRPGR